MLGQTVKLQLAGTAYQMRASWKAQREIEGATETPIAILLSAHQQHALKLDEICEIVWHGCQAGGEKFDSPDVLAELIFEARVTDTELRRAVTQFLLLCLYAPDEAKKKLEDLEPSEIKTDPIRTDGIE